VIARQEVQMDFSDTAKDLYERLEDAQVELFQEMWPDVIAGDLSVTEQDESKGTYHRTSDFEKLCKLDPDEEVEVKDFLDRLRALTFSPYDNAEIEVDGETYYVEVDIEKA
jgi:methionyl-tRNA formyltransferase